MKASEFLYEMGEYIAENGFVPEWNMAPTNPDCGCFWHAESVVAGVGHQGLAAPHPSEVPSDIRDQALQALGEVVNPPTKRVLPFGEDYFGEDYLKAAGWVSCISDPKVTKDAAAACFIAGDLLAAEGE